MPGAAPRAAREGDGGGGGEAPAPEEAAKAAPTADADRRREPTAVPGGDVPREDAAAAKAKGGEEGAEASGEGAAADAKTAQAGGEEVAEASGEAAADAPAEQAGGEKEAGAAEAEAGQPRGGHLHSRVEPPKNVICGPRCIFHRDSQH